MSALLLMAAILAVTTSFALFALSQPRHWQDVTGAPSPPPKAARRWGWTLMGTSMVLVTLRDGTSFGALTWPMLAGLGAAITAGTLTYAPILMKPIARWCNR